MKRKDKHQQTISYLRITRLTVNFKAVFILVINYKIWFGHKYLISSQQVNSSICFHFILFSMLFVWNKITIRKHIARKHTQYTKTRYVEISLFPYTYLIEFPSVSIHLFCSCLKPERIVVKRDLMLVSSWTRSYR